MMYRASFTIANIVDLKLIDIYGVSGVRKAEWRGGIYLWHDKNRDVSMNRIGSRIYIESPEKYVVLMGEARARNGGIYKIYLLFDMESRNILFYSTNHPRGKTYTSELAKRIAEDGYRLTRLSSWYKRMENISAYILHKLLNREITDEKRDVVNEADNKR